MNDSFHLQFALADRDVVLSPALFGEDDSSRRLRRKVRTASGNLRLRSMRSPVEARIDMAARGKRGVSKRCVETGQGIASARTRFALRSDHDHHNWFRSGKQERSGLDRGHVYTARLLVDHAPRVCSDQAYPDRVG